jgi:hypothetical protein
MSLLGLKTLALLVALISSYIILRRAYPPYNNDAVREDSEERARERIRDT